MASRSLGTLTLDLVVKMGGFVAGMGQAERKVDTFARNAQRKISGVGKFIGTALGVSIAGALTGVVAGISNAIDRMDSLRDASIRLGVGVETLSAYSFAAEQLGTDIDALGKGFKILAKNIADAGEGKGKAPVFAALGISLKDAEGNLRSLEDVIPDIANAFKQLEDGTQKAALAQELFGKSGLDLIEFLNQGEEGLKAFTDKARELGLVIDQDAADKADEFNDLLAEMKGTFSGLATEIGIVLLPELISLTKEFLAFIQEGDKADIIARELGGTIKGLGEIAGGVVGIFNILGATFRGVAADLNALDQMGDATQKLFRLDIEGARESVARAREFRAEAAKASDEIGTILESSNKLKAAIPKTPLDGMFTVPGARQSFSAVPTTTPQTGWVSATRGPDTRALARALGGITPGGAGRKSSGGKSDAQKEAEDIAKAIEKMTEAQREWQAELDGTGNQIADDYAKRLAQITDQAKEFSEAGVPTEKVAEFRAEMERLAVAIQDKETVEFLKEFNLQTEEMAASASGVSTATFEYARAMEALNEQLASGIINQDAFAERAAALALVRDSAANSVLASIREEQDLLGTTAQYQDTYNKLAYAGVSANSELGQAIIAANDALYQQREAMTDQIEIMDSMRDAGRGIFDDLREGVGIWDALKNAAEDFAATLFRMGSNKLVEKALGQQGTAGTGQSGGWLSSLFSAWLGGSSGGGGGSALNGSFAIGGVAQAGGLYRVNENGPEIASFGGRDYLMVGSQSGVVTPISNQARPQRAGGNTYVYQFAAPQERRTVDDLRARREVEDRRSAMRNN